MQKNPIDEAITYLIILRDGSAPKMCTSGGPQCKTIQILRLRILVHPNQI